MIGWTIAAFLAAASSQPGDAPAAISAEHQPARLDALLASRDYMTLGRTIRDVSRQADLRSDLDWLRARMLEGNSAFVTMLYSRLLWVAAGGLPEPQKRGMRQTAAMTTLYAYGAIRIDGARCGDPSAPSHRAEQLMTWNPEVWPFIRSLTAEERQQLVDISVAIEARTAARRDSSGDVDFLCRGGLEETQYNLAHGSAREVPTPQGGIGTTIELSGDGRYRPSETPEAEWRARAGQYRAALASDLTQLVAAMASAADTSTGSNEASERD